MKRYKELKHPYMVLEQMISHAQEKDNKQHLLCHESRSKMAVFVPSAMAREIFTSVVNGCLHWNIHFPQPMASSIDDY